MRQHSRFWTFFNQSHHHPEFWQLNPPSVTVGTGWKSALGVSHLSATLNQRPFEDRNETMPVFHICVIEYCVLCSDYMYFRFFLSFFKSASQVLKRGPIFLCNLVHGYSLCLMWYINYYRKIAESPHHACITKDWNVIYT